MDISTIVIIAFAAWGIPKWLSWNRRSKARNVIRAPLADIDVIGSWDGWGTHGLASVKSLLTDEYWE